MSQVTITKAQSQSAQAKDRSIQMTATIQINVDLWTKFSGLAQEKRKRPNRLLEKIIAEYLAIQQDLQLDEAIRQQARKSGFKENDAVELVKRYRQTKTL